MCFGPLQCVKAYFGSPLGKIKTGIIFSCVKLMIINLILCSETGRIVEQFDYSMIYSRDLNALSL
jgi:hypothetical protein